jgi:hypothetical protein
MEMFAIICINVMLHITETSPTTFDVKPANLIKRIPVYFNKHCVKCGAWGITAVKAPCY